MLLGFTHFFGGQSQKRSKFTNRNFRPRKALKLLSIFSVEAREKTAVKIYKKSTRCVHFTILPASPCAADFYETRHTRWTHRRNHVCQIFSRSVQGLRSSDTPKIAISHWLAASPLQQCSTAVRHCHLYIVHCLYMNLWFHAVHEDGIVWYW